jgi:hypothetical protein
MAMYKAVTPTTNQTKVVHRNEIGKYAKTRGVTCYEIGFEMII